MGGDAGLSKRGSDPHGSPGTPTSELGPASYDTPDAPDEPPEDPLGPPGILPEDGGRSLGDGPPQVRSLSVSFPCVLCRDPRHSVVDCPMVVPEGGGEEGG